MSKIAQLTMNCTTTLAVISGFVTSVNGYGLIYRSRYALHQEDLFLFHGSANLILGGLCIVFALLALRYERDAVLGTFFSVLGIALLNAYLLTMGETGYLYSLLTLAFCGMLVPSLKPSG